MSDNSRLVLSALRETNPELADSISVGDSWKDELLEQGARVTLYRQYEEGDHRSGITEQMRKMLRLEPDNSGIDDFNDNYCRIIVDKMAGRLQVSNISTGNDSDDNSWLIPLMQKNDWAAIQGTLFQGAIRDGESFLMINPKTLQWTSEPTYDGFSGVVAIFEAHGKTPIWACKLWSESIGGEDIDSGMAPMRIVVYEPNRITYWHGSENGSEVMPDDNVEFSDAFADDLTEEGMTATNELKWPLGVVPIIHFVNQYNNFNMSGRSEVRSAIPLQDVLNRTLHSMVMASEFSAFRVKWSIGMEINAFAITPGSIINLVLKDKNGAVVHEMSPDEVNFMNAVRVGQFEETNIEQYISQIDRLAREISQISQTPIYGVTTNGVLSGEALKQLEIGLIGKCERFQRENTDAIRQLVKMTAQMQNTFSIGLGQAPIIEQAIVTWKSPEILDTNAQVASLVNMREKSPGLWSDDFYRRKLGGILGMTQEEIKTESEGMKLALQTEALFWQAAQSAVSAGVPLETFLRRMGWTDEDLAIMGTQKLAKIKLEQEDVIPETRQ